MRSLKKISEIQKRFPKFKPEWKNLNKDTILAHKKFGKITHEVICEEDGKPLYDLPIIDLRDSCVVIPYTKDKNGKITNVLLIESERTASGLTLKEFPAGYLEENESSEEAAIRELREETDYEPISKPIFLGSLVISAAITKKPEAHVFAVEVKLSKTKTIHKEKRESKITKQSLITINELDKFLSSAENYCNFTLGPIALFRSRFRDFF